MQRKQMIAAAGLAAAMTFSGLATSSLAAKPQYKKFGAVGVTDDNRLVKFKLGTPGRPEVVGRIQGLTGDTSIIGIDIRVQDLRLYAVGDQGGVYVINRSNARATKLHTMTVAPNGTNFGVDFNPAADRLRVVSDTGQNLRHNVNDGTTVADTTLTVPPATTAAPGITGGAYTNNDLDANTGTVLYDIDVTNDQVVIQAPANNGTLSLVGKLGVDATDASYDIYSFIKDGKAQRLRGFASLLVGGQWGFYEIRMGSGAAVKLGNFPAALDVQHIAVRPGQN